MNSPKIAPALKTAAAGIVMTLAAATNATADKTSTHTHDIITGENGICMPKWSAACMWEAANNSTIWTYIQKAMDPVREALHITTPALDAAKKNTTSK